MQTLTYKVNFAPEGIPTTVRLSQNENGRSLQFAFIGDRITIPDGSVVTISGTKPDGHVYSAEGTLDGDVATFDEEIQMTAAAGEWAAKLKVTHNGLTVATQRLWMIIDADTALPGSVPSESELNGLVAEAQQYAENARSAAYGSPLTATLAADMLDTSRVYVYTGSETGMIFGHWYYYEDGEWEDGGVYQSQGVQTDTTLSITGMPADAGAAGTALDGKVNAEAGKGLSSNDFTTAEKTKLAGIADQATRVLVDSTLKVSGMAADSKIVGDEIDGLKEDLSELSPVKESTTDDVDLDISDAVGNVLVRFENGHIKTKNFDSSEAGNGIKNSNASGVDLDISDPSGNVILRLKDGHIKTKKFDSENVEIGLCYVSTVGSDLNDGSSSYPFATMQHAIDSGYTRIMVAPGEYKNQKVTIDGKHGISIICNTSTKESNLFESHQRQARAKLDNSIDVSGLVSYNSIYRTALDVDEDSSYYKVFVSQEVDPVYSGSAYYGRVTTYNAILWEITDDILTCTRLVPKLTLSECEATAGTFFYDGDYLYVHPTNGSLTGVSYKRLNDDTFTSLTRGFYVHNSTDIYIEGLDIQYFPYYDFHANLVSGLVMRDCGFYFTCYGSAAEYQNCNGDMWECNAAKAGADGFGIASCGNTSFYDCNAVYCYDDGISHHDESTGIIDGGIWTYCKKGGVTPSFGSHVTVKNVIATHNVYGIYWTQNGERVTDGAQYMQNCLAVDNTTKDIKITGYDVVAHGCSYGTKEVDTGASLTEYNSTIIV